MKKPALANPKTIQSLEYSQQVIQHWTTQENNSRTGEYLGTNPLLEDPGK